MKRMYRLVVSALLCLILLPGGTTLAEPQLSGSVENAALPGQHETRVVDVSLWTDDDGQEIYMLCDTARSIVVGQAVNAHHSDFGFPFNYEYDAVTGIDPVRWATNDACSAQVGVDALYNAERAYDLYSTCFGWESPDGTGGCELYLILDVDRLTDDYSSESFSRNAATNGDAQTAYIWFGGAQEGHDYANSLATVLHEYTHAVLTARGHAVDTLESRAVSEAYADIMALTLLNEGWQIAQRRLDDPEATGHRSRLDDYTARDDAYQLGTVLGHAAYLMTTGMDGGRGALSCEQTARLFFTSMRYLAQSMTMADSARCLELAALQLSDAAYLARDQAQCVSWALSQVGITAVRNAGLTVSPSGFELLLFDRNDAVYSDYTAAVYRPHCLEPDFVVSPTGNTCLIDVDLLYDGAYLLLTDNRNPALTMNFELTVRDDGANLWSLYSPFGADEQARQPAGAGEGAAELQAFLDALAARRGWAQTGTYLTNGTVSGYDKIDPNVMNGLLGARIVDLDGNGDLELIVIDAECTAGETLVISVYGCGPEGVTLLDACSRAENGWFTSMGDMRYGFALTEADGQTLLSVYSYRSVNDSIESLVLLELSDGRLALRDSATVFVHYNGGEFLKQPEQTLPFSLSYATGDDSNYWKVVCGGYADDGTFSAYQAEALAAYRAALAPYGIARDSDANLTGESDFLTPAKNLPQDLMTGSLDWICSFCHAFGYENESYALMIHERF